MTIYYGIMNTQDGVRISIPDLPGCKGFGSCYADALEDVMTKAREWLQNSTARGFEEPIPSEIESIVHIAKKDEYMIMIPLHLDGGRSVRANISLKADLLNDIDREAKLRGLTRSSFIASAVRDIIKKDKCVAT